MFFCTIVTGSVTDCDTRYTRCTDNLCKTFDMAALSIDRALGIMCLWCAWGVSLQNLCQFASQQIYQEDSIKTESIKSFSAQNNINVAKEKCNTQMMRLASPWTWKRPKFCITFSSSASGFPSSPTPSRECSLLCPIMIMSSRNSRGL